MERQAVAKVQKMPTGNHPERQSARSTSAGHPLLELQRAVGSHAIQRLTSSPLIQAKLQISTPEDPSEREADRVADSVMRMPVPQTGPSKETIATKPAVPLAVRDDDEEQKIQRLCTECEEEKRDQGQSGPMVHRKSAPDDDDVQEQQVQPSGVQTTTPKVTTSVASNIHAMNGGGSSLPATTRAFFEPRFGTDFSQVRVHTDSRAAETASSINARAFTVGQNIVFGTGRYSPHSNEGRQLLAHELTHVVQQNGGSAIQRQVASPVPASGATTDGDREATTAGMIVEDTATVLQPGQMKKSEFLAELRAEVCRAAEAVLAETGNTTRDCPYLDFWFGFYALKESRHIENAIHRYAPATSGAATARDYIPVVAQRVRSSVAVWAQTREVTGIPEGLPTDSGTAGSSESGESSAGPTGSIQFKAHDGGVSGNSNPQAIKTQLGTGRPLDGGVRSRMESAFGKSFSQVRVHTDATAGALSDGLNARAFTVGEHIAFGSSEYQPGSLIGDAIIAHELAHVMQQGSASKVIAPTQMGQGSYDQLEDDADQSAMAAGISLWGKTKRVLNGIIQNIKPRLTSGIQVQACRRTVHQCPRGLRWGVVGRPTATGPVCVCAWRCLPPGTGFSLYSDSGPTSSGPSISCANRDMFGRCPGEPNYETVDENYGVENEGTVIGVGAHMSPLGGQAACGCLPLNIEGAPDGQTEVHAPMLPPGLDVTSLAGMRGRPARDPRTGAITPGGRTTPPPAPTRAPTTQVGPAGRSGTPPTTPAAPRPAGPTPAPAGTTPSPAGPTPAPAGTTPRPAGPTPAPAGTTPRPAGPTPAPAGTTPRPAGPTPAGPAPTPAAIPRGTAPAAAENAAGHAAANGGAAQPGFVGNRVFANDGRGGGTVLPRQADDGTAITYREYDIHRHTPGVNRGAERVVIGSDGRRYYTSDHYRTFNEF